MRALEGAGGRACEGGGRSWKAAGGGGVGEGAGRVRDGGEIALLYSVCSYIASSLVYRAAIHILPDLDTQCSQGVSRDNEMSSHGAEIPQVRQNLSRAQADPEVAEMRPAMLQKNGRFKLSSEVTSRPMSLYKYALIYSSWCRHIQGVLRGEEQSYPELSANLGIISGRMLV